MIIRADGGAAFPVENEMRAREGMSLRDYFAAKAMQGAQSDPVIALLLGPKPNADKIAEYAYQMADAMLAERVK